MNNIELLDKKDCTGCLACYNICPQNAISLKVNYEGFYEPDVDSDKCINCGICTKTCAKLNGIRFNRVREAHAIICDDGIRNLCSSGGIWGALAYHMQANNGYVYGAVFSEDYRRVKHQRLQTIVEVNKSFGSKYLQSDVGYTYRDVRSNLQVGKNILFSGCPCQVDALKRFLKREYENLITVDILCHGVASPWSYEKFLTEIFDDVDSKIKKVGFRDKKFGWACNVVVVVAEDGTERVSPYSGSYYNAFLWGYSQRTACFSCPYSNSQRVGDLTIGDFWGIKNVLPMWKDFRGTSLMLVNTDKGAKIYSEISDSIKVDVVCSYNDVLDKTGDINWALIKPGNMPDTHDTFFYRLHRGDTFSNAFKYASAGEFEVGIFGWWFEDEWTNYGSILTYFALLEYVSSLGLSVCMIPSPFHKSKNATEFVKKHGYRICETYEFEYFWKHNDKIKIFLIGSDQLWFYDCYKEWGHALFLDFVSNKKKKIAYATSFGHTNPKIPEIEKAKIKKLLNRFDGISIRENAGVKFLHNEMNIDSVQTMDPVFLVNMDIWEKLMREAVRKANGNFIFAYILDPDNDKVKVLYKIQRKLGMPIISITDRQYGREKKENLLSDFGILRNASIYELIFHIMNAKYVMTDSYHGTCFSLIFRRKFVSFVNSKRGMARFETLEELLKINDRLVYDISNFEISEKIFERPNYYEISKLLDREISRSKAWLNNQLLNNNETYS